MTTKLYLDTRFPSSEAPLKLSVYSAGKSILIPLGLKIKPDQWKKEKLMVVDNPNADALNAVILSKKALVDREIIIQELQKKPLSEVKSILMDLLYPEKKKAPQNSFVSRYEHFLSLKDKPKTIKGYKWTLSALRKFDSDLDKRTFEDITTDYLKDFRAHCGKKLNRNSINIHMRYIRAVFNDAIDAGITTNYPFRSIKIKRLPVKKKALTIEEMRSLCSYPCEPWQEQYRDMFKLMFFFRGINAVDLFSATPSQIINGRFEYRRSKVGTLFSIKIEPEAWEIINKYKGKDHLVNPLDTYKDYEDYLHHMNKALKSIGRLRGKRGKVEVEGMFPELSSNWARHTWGTIGINIGIPKDVISRGMGHSFGVAVTEIYIDFDFSLVDAANRKIIDAVTK